MTALQSSSGAAAGGAAGLVLSTTSATGASSKVILEVDPYQSRARRCRKSLITGARLHVEESKASGFRGRWAFVTLTYRPGSSASPRDVTGFLKCVRSYFDRARRSWHWPRLRYLWCLELTKALVPHYHVLIWLPLGYQLPKPDKRGWWKHGWTNIERARRAVGYMAKYASKFSAEVCHALPKGFRTHAVGGLDNESRRVLRWWKSPLDAREALGETADIRKVKGGYLDRTTGEVWSSPWRVFLTGDGRLFAWRPAT